MTATCLPHRLPTNPFATRYTRPGALPPLDNLGHILDVAAMIPVLPAAGRIAAIVGPHGHGKSTLLAAIVRQSSALGRRVVCIGVDGPAAAVAAVAAIARVPPGSLVCIDGWDRMRCGTSWAARVLATRRGCGMLVTTHTDAGLPVLARCESSPAILAKLIGLLPDHGGRITPTDVDEAFLRHAGDVRESLFELYDRFENRVRERPPAGL